MNRYDWIEFHPKTPRRWWSFRNYGTGLHDSGYRFIRCVGVEMDRKTRELTRTELNQWADHVVMYGPVNIDVTDGGVIRLMTHGSRSGWYSPSDWGSDAEFFSLDPDADHRYIKTLGEIHRDVYGEKLPMKEESNAG